MKGSGQQSFLVKLRQAWALNQSLLCVGLDPLPHLFPASLAQSDHPILDFNKAIIKATADYACAFKPQIAHYAALGAEDQLQQTIQWLGSVYPQHLIILDAKRGDIDSTASLYATEAFDRYGADALTVNPYLGGDALMPFLQRSDRGCFILCRTSNAGSSDFQLQGQPPLYLQVAKAAAERWNDLQNVGLVVGATWPDDLQEVRKIAPLMPLLTPGVGAQKADLEKVLSQGLNAEGTGLIINASRSILYASSGANFAEAAGMEAASLWQKINDIRFGS